MGVGVVGVEEVVYYVDVAFIIAVLAELEDGVNVGDLYFHPGNTIYHCVDIAFRELLYKQWLFLSCFIFFMKAAEYVYSACIINEAYFATYMNGLIVPSGAHFLGVPA